MSEQEHTPGPWHLHTSPRGTVEIAATSRDVGTFVLYEQASYPFGAMVSGQVAANARLIAAAPDLLAACRAIVNAYDEGDPAKDNLRANLPRVREAIAKAEGAAK